MRLSKLPRKIASLIKRRLLGSKAPHWAEVPVSPPKIRGSAVSKVFRVAVIGIGTQGAKQCAALKTLEGVKLVGLADTDMARLERAKSDFCLEGARGFDDAGRMLRECGPLDLVSVATTAPNHLKLARLAVSAGVSKILIEKPISVSLKDARFFINECKAARVQVAVNYSRRWMPEYLAMKRCIKAGLIGEPRQISVVVGQGELAMHASHYFDLCCFLLADHPITAYGRLTASCETNSRGPQFQDPPGYAVFEFSLGCRVLVDFSADYGAKQGYLTLVGTEGRITVDERASVWTLHGLSGRSWSFTFAEALKAGPAFARPVAEILSGNSTEGFDGLWALEMIYAASQSSRQRTPVAMPLPHDCPDLSYVFP
jgi:predicted dehydrogenase